MVDHNALKKKSSTKDHNGLKKGVVCYAVAVLCSLVFSVTGRGGPVEGESVLRDGWEFSRDQKEWKGVRVPHDWAIAGPFDPEIDHGTAMLPWEGVGYYRRTIELPSDAAGKFVALRFGGVMARPEV